MPKLIGLVPLEETPDPIAFCAESLAPRLAESTVTLRYRLTATDARSLESLRYARRAMLREEWTRGVEAGEPSLEDAVFSAFDVAWPIRTDQRRRCVAKLAELIDRANRALEELARVS
ncbi:MAG TPA: hypothetical protein VGL03_12320 [Thermoanaerobaculia bacterium]|jgi:hypothetical protein